MKVFLPTSILLIIGSIFYGFQFILVGKGISVGSMLGIVVGLIFSFLD